MMQLPAQFHQAKRLFQVRHALEAMYMPREDRDALGELAMNLERKIENKSVWNHRKI